jgi:pimeloyl-ACP methyl ester carboxylesterase
MRLPSPRSIRSVARSTPPLWQEARFGLELASLLRHPVMRSPSLPHGRGAPVLLIPGFLAGDDSLRVMSGWLERAGYRPERAGFRLNAGCAAAAVERLEQRLERLAEQAGPVTIVGQSRGGAIARLLALRRPELVAGVVTLGTPHMNPFAVHPLVLLQVGTVGLLGTLGVPGLFKRSCFDGECCEVVRKEVFEPLPKRIRFISLYSRLDGIVDWRACLAPDAEHVEISSSHCGMGVHPGTYEVLADALPSLTRESRAATPIGTSSRPSARVARAEPAA